MRSSIDRHASGVLVFAALLGAAARLAAQTASAVDPPVVAPSFPCVPDGSTLCFLGGRFQARLAAQDPHTGRTTSGTAVAQGDAFGYFSLPDLTGDVTLPEVLVKMVDARVAPWNDDWVFYGSLTDVTYVMSVTDTTSGRTHVYGNDPGNPYCGGADTSSFPTASAPSPSSPPAPALGPASDALSLINGRFRVALASVDPRTGQVVSGSALQAGDRFGFFGLPAITGIPDLPEVCVKMLDGTSLNHAFWLFESSLTSLPYELTVVDTTTNETQTYDSGGAFCSAADTSAFIVPGPDTPPPAGTPEIDGRWSGFFDTSDDADCDGHVAVSIVFHQDGTRITGGPFRAVGACEMGGIIEGTLQGPNFFGRVIHSGFSGGTTVGTASPDQITLSIADLVRPIDAFSGELIPHGVLTLHR